MIKYLMIFMILLLLGCQNETNVKHDSMVDATGFVVSEQDTVQTKEFTIRAVANQFSPDTIRVNKGDHVVLHITNELVNTGGTRSGQDISDASRFGITDYNVEGFYHDGGTLTLKFKADHAGIFDFGDESRAIPKGRLIVD